MNVMKTHTVKANAEYVWTVKNKKQEQTQGEDPVHALTEFGQKHGTRGEIRVNRWQRTNGDMLTSTGVFFKGTFKEVVEKLKHHVSTATANGGSFKTSWNPMETKLFNILKTVDYDDGIELEALRKQLAGKAWDDLKKIPAPVDKAIESLIRSSYAMKTKTAGKWFVMPVEIGHRKAQADFNEVNAEPDVEKAPPTGVDFVGNAVIGDLKRIKSLIATWSKKTGKGSMDKDQLKAYVAYQKDLAGYIAKTYLPKLNKSYQAKVKAI